MRAVGDDSLVATGVAKVALPPLVGPPGVWTRHPRPWGDAVVVVVVDGVVVEYRI